MRVILQDGIKDCGICCLLSIIRFYGGDVSKEYLREITNTTKEGVSFYNLIEAAKKIGFEAIGVTGKLEDIKVNNLPCIVHFIVNKSYKHFIVLYQINKKKQTVTIMDPAKGKRTISIAEFKLLTSSNYLFLTPIKKLPKITKRNRIYENIKTQFQKNKSILFQITLLTFSYFFLNIITSFHFKYIFEYSINYNISNNLFFISYWLCFAYLLKNINILFRNILLSKWTLIFDYKTTSLTYKQLLLLPYLYYKNRTTGEVISRFKDLNTIRSFLSNFFCILTTDFISMLIFYAIMKKYSKNLTKIILLPILLLSITSLVFYKKKKKQVRLISKGEDQVNSYIIQGVMNVDTIKGFHLEKRLIDKFSLQYKSFLDKIYKFKLTEEFHNFIQTNIEETINTIIYGIGSFYIIKGNLFLSNFILYQTFFNYFKGNFKSIILLIEEYSSYKVALERIEDIFMINKDNFENNYFYLSYQLKGDIVFKNVDYKIGSKILLNKLNLEIKHGEKVLLSGESGCGKSTLLKMLLRYIEIDYGHIKIDNIDINHYHLENIRTNITYVTSNEYLFTDTLKNNILLYKEHTEEEFKKVCKMCFVDDIIENKMTGYDSLIEENGFNLSTGEKQRIVLARSILRKSNIYIFDEALSGIDIERERKILKKVFEYLKDKTIIVISHRFNNKTCFSRVLKMEKGKIYEKS